MGLPTLSVDVAFDTDPLAVIPTWTDISAYCDGISVDFGKQAQLDAYQPGKLTLRLKNDDRRFDPLHATGPYYGKLTPRKKLRVRATWSGVTYEVYTGFVDGWTQRPSGQKTQTTTVTCTDLFGLLANIELPSSVYAIEVDTANPVGWWRLNETAGNVAADSSGKDRDGTYDYEQPSLSGRHPNQWETEPGIVLDADLRPITIPNAADLITARPLSVEFIHQVVRITGETELYYPIYWRGSSIAFFVDVANLGATWNLRFQYRTAAYPANNWARLEVMTRDPFAHHLAFTLSAAGVINIYIDGVNQSAPLSSTVATFTTGNQLYLATAGSGYPPSPNLAPYQYMEGPFADVAVYDSELSAAVVLAHANAFSAPWAGDTSGGRALRLAELAGLTSTQYNLDTGVSTLGPAVLGSTVLPKLREIEATEQGHLYIDHADAGKLRFENRHNRLLATRSTVVQATFTDEDTPGTIHVERGSIEVLSDWQLVYNEITVTYAGGGSVTVSDTASITAHGRRTHTVDTLVATATEARNLAEWVLSHYKDPIARIQSLTLNPTGDDTSAVKALDLRLGDLVEVKFKPQNVGSRETFRVLVEGKQHQFDKAAGTWTTTLYLSPAETKVYGIWDSGLWDQALWGY